MLTPQYKAEGIALEYSHKLSETEYEVIVKTSGFLPHNYRHTRRTVEGNDIIIDDFFIRFKSTVANLKQNIGIVKGYVQSDNEVFQSEFRKTEGDLLQSGMSNYHDQKEKQELNAINQHWDSITPITPK